MSSMARDDLERSGLNQVIPLSFTGPNMDLPKTRSM